MSNLRGVTFDWKDECVDLGFIPSTKHETGVIAQEVQAVIPDAVSPAPFDSNYLTVDKEKIIPVLIEAIKELKAEVDELKAGAVMPLQTSGAISLNQIHIEAGGSSGTQASLNDSDIRGLIGKASGATSSFSNFYGASGNWSPTVTIGNATVLKTTVYGFLKEAMAQYQTLLSTTLVIDRMHRS